MMLNIEPNQTNKKGGSKNYAQYLFTKTVIFHKTVREDRPEC